MLGMQLSRAYLCLLFLYSSRAHRDLHSFPTRRSSDLDASRSGPEGATARPRVSNDGRGAGKSSARRAAGGGGPPVRDRKSTRLNSSHANISYAVFCLKKKKEERPRHFRTTEARLPTIL